MFTYLGFKRHLRSFLTLIIRLGSSNPSNSASPKAVFFRISWIHWVCQASTEIWRKFRLPSVWPGIWACVRQGTWQIVEGWEEVGRSYMQRSKMNSDLFRDNGTLVEPYLTIIFNRTYKGLPLFLHVSWFALQQQLHHCMTRCPSLCATSKALVLYGTCYDPKIWS